MSRLLLDTNIVSYLMKRKPEVEQYRPHLAGQTLCISFITVGELYAGAEKGNWSPNHRAKLEDHLQRYVVLPYDVEVARRYGVVRGRVESVGRPMENNDAWIAATALAYDCKLVTHNRRHFDSVPGLEVISEAP